MFKLIFKNSKSKPANGRMSISSILDGCAVARMQSVGYMQVIPLVNTKHDERFVSPAEAHVGTEGYGNMRFKNETDGLLVVPLHAGYLVSQRAQNHAMAHAAILGAKKNKLYKTAMCIQASQGGYIKGAKHKLSILPHQLREKALDKRKTVSYNKLWDDISAFNGSFGLNKRGHLEDFLKKFKQELDQFVAEFENIPNQVGAIILIDGNIVGIERAPSQTYWAGVWPALIRECYGALALQYRKKMGNQPQLPKVRFTLNSNVKTMTDIRKALEEARKKEDDAIKNAVKSIMRRTFQTKEEKSDLDGFDLKTLDGTQLKGQILEENGEVLYASLFRRASWKEKNVNVLVS